MNKHCEAHKAHILNAAIAEFGRVGYAAASTNEIVKQAKVSKGLLFHHFENKQKLYIACQAYVLEQYGQFMAARLFFDSDDFFDRILHSMRVKLKFGFENPSYLALINRAWHLDGDENPLERRDAESIALAAMQMQGVSKFFEGVDTGLFRDGVDMAKAMDCTRLALEGAWVRFMLRHGNNAKAMAGELQTYMDESEAIVAIIRHGAYK